MVELVEDKKNHLSSILKIQNYLLECSEIKSQIREKRKAIESTQYSSGDLGSVLSLQRRLSTIEAALVLLEPRLVELQQEGESLATTHPTQAMEVLMQFEEISEEWEALKKTLQGCEDSLTVASRSVGPVVEGAGSGAHHRWSTKVAREADRGKGVSGGLSLARPLLAGCSSSSRTWTAF